MEQFASLAPAIQEHLRQITRTSGLPDTSASHELLAKAWLEKKARFERVIADNNMESRQFFAREEERGALILTWSGSLLTIAPPVDGRRHCAYTSVGLRTDVPAAAETADASLAGDVETDQPVLFARGPVQQSSPVFQIAVFSGQLKSVDEARLLDSVNQTIAEDFVEVNKTIVG